MQKFPPALQWPAVLSKDLGDVEWEQEYEDEKLRRVFLRLGVEMVDEAGNWLRRKVPKMLSMDGFC